MSQTLTDARKLRDQGIALLRQGKPGDATVRLEAALHAAPRDAMTHNCLGIARKTQGELHNAEQSYREAIRLAPSFAAAHNNLGVVLQEQERLQEARESFEFALQRSPEFAEAYNNLGNVLLRLQQPDKALECFQRALHINWEFAAAHNNLGLAYKELGQMEGAMASYRQAVQLDPGSAEAYSNLGNALRERGRLAEAVECFCRSLQLRPNYPIAQNNLAHALVEQGRLDDAATLYRHALQAQPGYSEAQLGLANALHQLGETEQAMMACRQLLQREPEHADATLHLATMLEGRGELDEAAALYERASRLSPDRRLWQLHQATLCPAVFSDCDHLQQYRQQLESTVQQVAVAPPSLAWQEIPSFASAPPFHLQFLDGNLRQLRESYAQMFAGCFPSEPPRCSGRVTPRIGMLVTARHEGIFLRSMRGILERLNPDCLELVVLCARSGETKLRSALASSGIPVVGFGGSFARTAETIREVACDVLYFWEIGTDATNYFLPFLKLAPVQCTGWGYQLTSGIPQVDYYLSNQLMEPEDAQEHYSEHLIRAATMLVQQARPAPADGAEMRARLGIGAQDHLYACVQHPGKIHPDFDPLLGGILQRDSAAKLVIAGGSGKDVDLLRQRLLISTGATPDRLLCLPYQQHRDYLNLLAAADVLLDPPHFNGANSTFDGLGLGKPIVTWPSGFRRGRFTLGCYRKMQIEDCIAESGEQYIELAVQLGTDSVQRQQLSQRIIRESCILFDDASAAVEMEDIFLQLAARAREEQ